ncbi:predicted protein [Naegleria gruberi]|uniref:Predicted protein n=1 Tax=Naegleria gruberi TaxID=5762 RepID=D2W153_NAEGR|nr:uncharacterized protein NAEGRDRAFT_53889 [Naegleria gruberi]EFC37171.1 predicted protein [Naegleria gruberi]|eukprot:XP_002669915.1 predicted protein [Naegleria gruberi strain NEG-M]
MSKKSQMIDNSAIGGSSSGRMVPLGNANPNTNRTSPFEQAYMQQGGYSVPQNQQYASPFVQQQQQFGYHPTSFYVAPGSTGSSHGVVTSRNPSDNIQYQSTNQNALMIFNTMVQQFTQMNNLSADDKKKCAKIVNEFHNSNNTLQKESLIFACFDQMYLLFNSPQQQQQNDLRYIYVSMSYLAKKNVEVFDTINIKQKLLSYLFLTNKHFGTGAPPSGTGNPQGGTGGPNQPNVGASGPNAQTSVVKKGTYFCLICCDILFKLSNGLLNGSEMLQQGDVTSLLSGEDISSNSPSSSSEEWNWEFICALFNDSLEDRIWCEHEYAKEFVDNILSGIRDPETTTVVNDTEYANIPSRYNEYSTLTKVKEIVISILDQFRGNTKKRLENIIRFCTYCVKVREVRSFAAKNMESWLGNTNLQIVKYAKDLLTRMSFYIREDQPDMFQEGDRVAFDYIVNMKLKPNNIQTQVDAVANIVKNNVAFPVIALRKFLLMEAPPHHKSGNTFKNLLTIFKAIPSYRERHLGYTLQEMVASGDAEYFKTFKMLTRKIIKSSYYPPSQSASSAANATTGQFDFVDLCSSLFVEREQMKQQNLQTRKRWITNLFELVRMIILSIIISHNQKEVEDQELRFKVSLIQNDAIAWCRGKLPVYLGTDKDELNSFLQKFLFFDIQQLSDNNFMQAVLGELPPNPPVAFEQIRYWLEELPCEQASLLNIQEMALVDQNLKYADALFLLQTQVLKSAKFRYRMVATRQFLQTNNKPLPQVLNRPSLYVSSVDIIRNMLELCKYNSNIQPLDEKFTDEIVLRQWYWNSVLVSVIIISMNPQTLCEPIMSTFPTFRNIIEYLIKNQLQFMESDIESEYLVREERDIIERIFRKNNQPYENIMDTFMLHERTQVGNGERRVMPIAIQRDLRRYEVEFQLGRCLRGCRQPDLLMQMIQKEPNVSNAIAWIDSIIQISQDEAQVTIQVLPSSILCEYLVSILKRRNDTQNQNLIFQIIEKLKLYLRGSVQGDAVNVSTFFISRLANEDFMERKLSQYALCKLLDGSENNEYDWVLDIDKLQFVDTQILWETFSKLIMIETDINFLTSFIHLMQLKRLDFNLCLEVSNMLTKRRYFSEKLLVNNFREISLTLQEVFYMSFDIQTQSNIQTFVDPQELIVIQSMNSTLTSSINFLNGLLAFVSIIYSIPTLSTTDNFMQVLSLIQKSSYYYFENNPQDTRSLVSKEYALIFVGSHATNLVDIGVSMLNVTDMLLLLNGTHFLTDYSMCSIYSRLASVTEFFSYANSLQPNERQDIQSFLKMSILHGKNPDYAQLQQLILYSIEINMKEESEFNENICFDAFVRTENVENSTLMTDDEEFIIQSYSDDATFSHMYAFTANSLVELFASSRSKREEEIISILNFISFINHSTGLNSRVSDVERNSELLSSLVIALGNYYQDSTFFDEFHNGFGLYCLINISLHTNLLNEPASEWFNYLVKAFYCVNNQTYSLHLGNSILSSFVEHLDNTLQLETPNITSIAEDKDLSLYQYSIEMKSYDGEVQLKQDFESLSPLLVKLIGSGSSISEYIVKWIVENSTSNDLSMLSKLFSLMQPNDLQATLLSGLFLDSISQNDPSSYSKTTQNALFVSNPEFDSIRPYVSTFLMTSMIHSSSRQELTVHLNEIYKVSEKDLLVKSTLRFIQVYKAMTNIDDIYTNSRLKLPITLKSDICLFVTSCILSLLKENMNGSYDTTLLTMLSEYPYSDYLSLLVDIMSQSEKNLQVTVKFLMNQLDDEKSQTLLRWIYCCFPTQLSNELQKLDNLNELLTPIVSNESLCKNMTTSLDAMLHRLGHLLSYYSYTDNVEISNFAFSMFRQIAFLYPYLVIRYLDNILALIETNFSSSKTSTEELRPILRISTQILAILDALRPHLFNFKDILIQILETYFTILNQSSMIVNSDQHLFVEFVSKFMDFVCNYILFEGYKSNMDTLNFLANQKDLIIKIQEIFPEIPKIKYLLNILHQLDNIQEENAFLLINKKQFTLLPVTEEEIFQFRIRLNYNQFLTLQDSTVNSTFASHLTTNLNHRNVHHLNGGSNGTLNGSSSAIVVSSSSMAKEYSSKLHYNSSQLKSNNRMLMDTLTDIDSISQYEPGILVHFIPQLLDLLIVKSNRQVMEISYQLLIRCLQHDSKQHVTIIPFYLDCLVHENTNVKDIAIKYAYDLFPFCNTNESKQILLERLFIIAEKEPPRVLHANLNPTISQNAMRTLTKIIDMLIKIN